MPMHRHALSLAIAVVFHLIATPSHAADVVVQPSSGSGFVVKDAAGANERLRVQESGVISMPSVATAPAQTQGLCMSASGQLGPCSGGGSYTAATGLNLTGTTFSVAPTYRLPQSCATNQIAQWNGTAWACGNTGGGSLPAGMANETLRYDSTNTWVANSLLQALSDGGLVAGGILDHGSVPATGSGARLMWYPAKAAFRAGYSGGSEWDDAYIGKFSTAAGIDAMASGPASTALGQEAAALGSNTTAMGFNTMARGAFSTAIGRNSVAKGDSSTAMGYGATANGSASAAIGSGVNANGDQSTALGFSTTAGGDQSTAMGYATQASGKISTAMGYTSIASGDYSTAMGITTASGEQSTSMGSYVDTNGHKGAFIYGDASSRNQVSNYADNQFQVIATGGVNFYTGIDPVTRNPSVGAGLAVGSGTWTTISDRNAKTAVRPVDGREVLKKVAAMPLNTWQYKTQEAKYRHMGPMAQDFYAAFELGESDKGIDTVDADGVALAAIQGLNALLAEKDGQIAALRAEVTAQAKDKDEQIAKLRAELTTRVAALESVAGDLAEMKAAFAASRRAVPAETALALRQPR